MSRIRFIIWLISLSSFASLLMHTVPARAQEPISVGDENCTACHTHQYYLYDTGKWFCLCEAPMHCVYCHSGRTDTRVKEHAHEGLVLYPTRSHAERCQECHEEDYLSRVVAFANTAGVSAEPQPLITATPVEPVAASVIEAEPTSWLRLGYLSPWRQVDLAVIAVGLVGTFIFGFRCWKTDCGVKSTGTS